MSSLNVDEIRQRLARERLEQLYGEALALICFNEGHVQGLPGDRPHLIEMRKALQDKIRGQRG